MFSTAEFLRKRTGKNKTDRPKFLKLLVDEFKQSKKKAAKEQVLGNLANFAYDPINYDYIRELKIVDLFLDEVSEGDVNVEFALAGLCNLCLDKENKDYILSNGGIESIVQCLSSSDEEIVITAITTLIFLVTPQSKPQLTVPPIVEFMVTISKLSNPRLKNLALIFLGDICTPEQVEEAEMKAIQNIPIPQ